MEYELSNKYKVKIEPKKYISLIGIYDCIGLLVIKFHISNEFLLSLFDKIENALNESESLRFTIPNVYCYYSSIFICLECYDSDNIMIGIGNTSSIHNYLFNDFAIISNEDAVKNFFSKVEIDFINELTRIIPEVSTL